jgi:hypothetical protein
LHDFNSQNNDLTGQEEMQPSPLPPPCTPSNFRSNALPDKGDCHGSSISNNDI